MRSATRLGWLLVSVLSFWAGPGVAADIEWNAPEPCPDADELRFRVERAIGMPLSHAAALRFDVRTEPSAGGYVAHIDVDAGAKVAPRQRALAASECGSLTDMVTVAVALALGVAPEGVTESEELGAGAGGALPGASAALGSTLPSASRDPADGAGAAADVSSDPARPASSDDADEDDPPGVPSSPRWRPGVALWLVGDTGSLPAPGAGLALGAQLERARFQLRASGTWFYGQHASIGSATGAEPGADLALVMGALAACAVPFGAPEAPLRAFGCGGWELGRLSGEGTGIERPRRRALLWNAARLDAGTSLALGSSGLRLSAILTLAVPLGRENFVLTELGSVHRPPSAVARAALGLEWIPR